MPKLENPVYGKNDHIRIINQIARGLAANGELKTYVELGIRAGTCFNEIAPRVEGTAYGVDIDERSHKYIKGNKNLSWHCCTTDAFFDEFRGSLERKVDLVFVDADHKYESAKKDFDNSLEVVRDGGLILMHDIYPPREDYLHPSICSDVYKLAEHIQQRLRTERGMYYGHRIEFVTLPFYHGIGIVRKLGKNHLLWQS